MCKVHDCERPSQTRLGFCVMHYKRFKRNGSVNRVLNSYEPGTVCYHCGDGGQLRRGLCKACSIRLMRKGYVERDRAPAGLGTINAGGYRLLSVDGKRVYEHRQVMLAKPGEVVHHKGAKNENTEDKLQVFASQSEHMKHHAREKG